MSMAQTQNLDTPKTILIFGVHHKVFTDSDVMEAAEQLLQLSDEDHSSNTTASDGNTNIADQASFDKNDDLSGGFCSQDEITSTKIDQISGRDDFEKQRPEAKRRYRPIADIYRETSPIVNVGNEKKKNNKVRY